uniref:Retrovirus-related Pol polyprotein from transposon TNT 1-94 n=1 Tax=Tanacetum cinerariifolium TaxID=118510 RepID=A0A699HTB9_TANCI|nr:hypothetical protein [Tanacetum cinerariifolium]
MALADDEITVGKSYARNDELVDITIRKDFQKNYDDEVDERSNEEYLRDLDVEYQERTLLANSKHFIKRRNNFSDYKAEYKKMKSKLALLEASPLSPHNPKTFQPKHKGLVSEIFDWDKEEVFDEKEVTHVKVLMALADDELTVGKNHARNGEWVDITMRKVERLNPNSKLPNFNTGRILVPKSQAVNESLETLNTPESSKDSKAKLLTPLPHLQNLQGASLSSEDSKPKVQNTGSSKSLRPKPIQKPQLKCELYHYTNHLTDDCYRILLCMICKKEDHRTSDHEMYIASFKINESYKALPYQYAFTSKKILKAKAKPLLPCTHCGFNDHRPDDCRNYIECEIYGSYDHSTSGHNHVIQIRREVLAESSQSNESSIRVKCNTYGNTVHSTSDHNKFDHFKRETHQGAHLVPRQWMLEEYDWCQELSAQICRATRLKIKQDDKGISICQEQYTRNLLNKYDISDSSSVKTHMVPPNNLDPDLAGKPVNETSYRGMIKSLMYLTTTRPIKFSIVLYAMYQSNPKESHLIDVKRILRYLKGTLTIGLYYPKCLGFNLKGYSNPDYAGYNIDIKITLAEAEYVTAVRCYASILWIKSQLSDYDINYKMCKLLAVGTYTASGNSLLAVGMPCAFYSQ